MRRFPIFLKTALGTAILTGIALSAAAGVIPEITTPVTTDFGTYTPVAVTVSPSVTPYVIESDLSNVSIADNVSIREDTADKLAANGFAAAASPYRRIYDIYNRCEDRTIPAFVTTDACLHTFHIMYDYILRIMEVNYFYDDLVNMLDALIGRTTGFYTAATDSTVKEAALDATAYLMVAMNQLEPDMLSGYELYPAVADIISDETGLITALSDGYVPSPLFFTGEYPYQEDYSQYKPRGHYTRSEKLERYFRAMMWLGRITFSVNIEGASQEGLRHAARQAVIITLAMVDGTLVGDESAETVFNRIYQPTVFFVGKSDDITYQDYWTFIQSVFPSQPAQNIDILGNNSDVDTFITAIIENTPDPKITVKAGKGFRLMGQRFIPDSYILDQMVDEFVPGRLMPRGLDVMTVFGSERAYEIVDTYYNDPATYSEYDPQIAFLKSEFRALPVSTWAENLYYNWLYSLAPLLEVKGGGYPPFMQAQAWTDKDLNTALGSWAELRHDTILYAKQSETRETSIDPPLLARGYVEPEPEVYARLAALAEYMKTGTENQGLLDPLFESRLDDYESLMLSLMEIAIKELEETPLSENDFIVINNFGSTIEDLTTFPPDAGVPESEADDFMAVIADVHTDPNYNEALEVGVGHPLTLYVIAPVNGTPTLTVGSIFSYHEFKQPLADGRLTDEEWQDLQSGPDAVDMPEWTESFLVGSSSLGQEPSIYINNPGVVVSVAEEKPQELHLYQNSPNPFNPSTTVSFSLDEDGPVTLAVYNLSGQRMTVLVDDIFSRGQYSVVWHPENIATGLYFIRLTAGSVTQTVKALFMK